MTPRGLGYVDAAMTVPGEILVTHRRNDFEKKEWLEMTPANGPCVFFTYDVSELEDSDAPSMYEPQRRTRLPRNRSKRKSRKSPEIITEAGGGVPLKKYQIWENKRTLSQYRILQVDPRKVKVESLKNGKTWFAYPDVFVSRHRLVPTEE